MANDAPAAAPETLRASPQSTAMMNVEQTKAIPQETPGGTEECPKGRINIGIFFDGTGNNNVDGHDEKTGAQSNVAKLFKLYIRKPPVSEKKYYQGVGTSFGTVWFGGATGAGGKNRSDAAYNDVTEFFNKDKNPLALQKIIDVYGFSRGAAIARDFVNRVHGEGIPDKSKPAVKKRVPHGRGGSIERSVHPRMEGVKIRFLGIFDTVSSFGLPGNNVDVGYNFNVNNKVVDNTAHAVAANERRNMFPLQSVNSGPDGKLPDNMEEKVFPGAHSDVGGGYDTTTTHYEGGSMGAPEMGIPYEPPTKFQKGNDMARAPLKWMHEKSVKAGVEIEPLPNSPEYQPSDKYKDLDARRATDPEAAKQWEREFMHDEATPGGTRTIYYQGSQL